jgi:putative Holliday junction resolvase
VTYLGIDYGKARIGLAIAMPPYIMAMPYKTIFNDNLAVNQIAKVVKDKKVSQIFIGYPIDLQGQKSYAANIIEQWLETDLKPTLKQLLGDSFLRVCQISLVDERFTTALATQKLCETGKKSKQYKKVIDQIAAAEILNSVL